jgi:hypothetical protein
MNTILLEKKMAQDRHRYMEGVFFRSFMQGMGRKNSGADFHFKSSNIYLITSCKFLFLAPVTSVRFFKCRCLLNYEPTRFIEFEELYVV